MARNTEATELEHGMLLDGKYVMDDPMPTLQNIKGLIPERLHDEFDSILNTFEEELAQCDVSDDFVEKPTRYLMSTQKDWDKIVEMFETNAFPFETSTEKTLYEMCKELRRHLQ